jgi:hypothetical protein
VTTHHPTSEAFAVRTPLALLAVIALAAPAVPGDEKSPATTPKLADCAWLTGAWRSAPGERMTLEEHWSAPSGGTMMGMFRMGGGRSAMYEFLLLEEQGDGTYLRLRHYGPGMADHDKAPFKLKLTAATNRRLEFTAVESETLKRIVYEREGEKGVVALVETTRNGQPARFTLKMNRTDAK